MSKKKKKPTKGKVDWKAILLTALVDLVVGFILLLIGKSM